MTPSAGVGSTLDTAHGLTLGVPLPLLPGQWARKDLPSLSRADSIPETHSSLREGEGSGWGEGRQLASQMGTKPQTPPRVCPCFS